MEFFSGVYTGFVALPVGKKQKSKECLGRNEILAANQYAWDGNTLWIKARFKRSKNPGFKFSD